MQLQRITRWVGVVALAAVVGGCNDLAVENPNAPDAKRALSDPDAVEALGAGAMRTWFDAFAHLSAAGVLSVQARTFSASWNNANMNFYSSIDNPTAAPEDWNRMSRAWQNDPSAAGRTSVEAFWNGAVDQTSTFRSGFYSALSAANDALSAIRTNNVVIRTDAETKRLETIDVFMQGASLMMLSLNYDKAYVADENSDPLNLQYMNRKEVRDAAIAKLQEAITLANANEFTTPVTWTNGIGYTNLQIAQIANTMAAMTLAYYPRDNSEVGSVDWAQVASFASQGMSAGSPVDFWFVADNSAWSHEVLAWFGEIDSGRLHTRVSHLLDPATQKDPWPATQGNPQPNSPDKRLGDGSFGDAGTQKSFKTTPKTALAGSDFAWTANGQAMRPDRGQYHQSNLAYIRYDESGVQDPDQQYGNKGPMPAINATLNDLIWAEALLRQGAGNAAQAATLIDKTRVVRGGLSSSAAAIGNIGADADGPCMSNGKLAKDGTACSLWSMLLYEQEIEALALGPAPFYQQRRLPLIVGGGFAGDNSPKRVIAGLLPGTPHEMPVPAKELGVKGEPLYTWGGSKPNSPAP